MTLVPRLATCLAALAILALAHPAAGAEPGLVVTSSLGGLEPSGTAPLTLAYAVANPTEQSAEAPPQTVDVPAGYRIEDHVLTHGAIDRDRWHPGTIAAGGRADLQLALVVADAPQSAPEAAPTHQGVSTAAANRGGRAGAPIVFPSNTPRRPLPI